MENYITKIGIGYDIHKLKKNIPNNKQSKYLILEGLKLLKVIL